MPPKKTKTESAKTTLNSLNFVVIDKNNSAKEITTTSFEELHKKCGHDNDKDFGLCYRWSIRLNNETNKKNIELYAKHKGRSPTLNSFIVPPLQQTSIPNPTPNPTLYGSCAIILKDEATNTIESLTLSLWQKIYAKLMLSEYFINPLLSQSSKSLDEINELDELNELDVLNTLDEAN